jgi:hypothetical protein
MRDNNVRASPGVWTGRKATTSALSAGVPRRSRSLWQLPGLGGRTWSQPVAKRSAGQRPRPLPRAGGWGGGGQAVWPWRLVGGADDLEVRVDEDVVGPVDADVVDLEVAVAEFHDAVDNATGVVAQRGFGRLVRGRAAGERP